MSQQNIQVVKFRADFCSKCKKLEPSFEALVEEKKVQVLVIDAEKDKETVELYEISKLPTFVVVKDGKEIGRAYDVEGLHKIL